MVARDEELRSASPIPLEVHILVVCFRVPEGQTGTACQWEDNTESHEEESVANDREQIQQIGDLLEGLFKKNIKIKIKCEKKKIRD